MMCTHIKLVRLLLVMDSSSLECEDALQLDLDTRSTLLRSDMYLVGTSKIFYQHRTSLITKGDYYFTNGVASPMLCFY